MNNTTAQFSSLASALITALPHQWPWIQLQPPSNPPPLIRQHVTYPLDLTKTRLQIQGEAASQATNGDKKLPHRGMVKTGLGIIREEGVSKLWRGVTPALYRHVVYSGCRIVTYEKIRASMSKNRDGTFPVWKSAISGVSSGALAQFLSSPADLVKKILSEGGIRGLWKGSIPNVQRAALVNLGDLTTYDTAKHLIISHTSLSDSHLTHVGMAGLVAATMGTPADVVKTRIMNQPTDINGRGLLYKSSLDCLLRTVENEGFLALYKGFLPVWIRMAPWSLTFWLSFEQIRHSLGATGF
ncbi:hypothetical protein M8J76_001747 [Diaphorina citri]|nr:hypothetical protein M8J76_001747 [Diaphorina citri]